MAGMLLLNTKTSSAPSVHINHSSQPKWNVTVMGRLSRAFLRLTFRRLWFLPSVHAIGLT